MAINRTRLDRFISEKCKVNRKSVRLMLAYKRITVDGVIATDIAQLINTFSVILLDNNIIQKNEPLYIMLHKPVGVVCATKDEQHTTVIDLLDETLSSNEKTSLHIVGRLDLNTSGLVLLTNDSRWSRRLMEPDKKVAKVYRVTLKKPLTDTYISAFFEGMYFEYENITTKPATLKIISDYVAEVTLIEGRYHQIKRMFGRFRNPVLALHRLSIGGIQLDSLLEPGDSRELYDQEIVQALESVVA